VPTLPDCHTPRVLSPPEPLAPLSWVNLLTGRCLKSECVLAVCRVFMQVIKCAPRVRGDDPLRNVSEYEFHSCSPRARG